MAPASRIRAGLINLIITAQYQWSAASKLPANTGELLNMFMQLLPELAQAARRI
jgi:hypothetical protein